MFLLLALLTHLGYNQPSQMFTLDICRDFCLDIKNRVTLIGVLLRLYTPVYRAPCLWLDELVVTPKEGHNGAGGYGCDLNLKSKESISSSMTLSREQTTLARALLVFSSRFCNFAMERSLAAAI